MHLTVINGSPRVKRFSNTDKILEKFLEGFSKDNNTYELFEISDRKSWDRIRSAYEASDNILIAIPLFVECIPGLLIEFLETLPKKNGAKMSFILQSGFAEGVQLRCGEDYLKIVAERLGCTYGGTLVKGNNFGIRLTEGKDQESQTLPYKEMGEVFARDKDLFSAECRAFTGPESYPLPIRLFVGLIFKTAAKSGFKKAAASWGCTKPLDYRPYTEY